MTGSYEQHIRQSKNFQNGVSLFKPSVKYSKGGAGSIGGTGAVTLSICSKPYRYPVQIEHIEKMMQQRNGKNEPLKMLCIGIAEGQEPLTYVQTALETAQNKNLKIDDILDMTLVEAADEIPINKHQAEQYGIDDEAVRYLENLYKDRNRTHFQTPLQDIVPELKKSKEKYDVILFNNVIQHMDFSDKEKVYKSVSDLTQCTKEGGLFCFETIYSCPEFNGIQLKKKFYDNVIAILDKNGFIQIDESVFQKKAGSKTVSDALKTQMLYNYQKK